VVIYPTPTQTFALGQAWRSCARTKEGMSVHLAIFTRGKRDGAYEGKILYRGKALCCHIGVHDSCLTSSIALTIKL